MQYRRCSHTNLSVHIISAHLLYLNVPYMNIALADFNDFETWTSLFLEVVGQVGY